MHMGLQKELWDCDPTVDHSYVNFFSCSHSMECRLLSDIEGHTSGGHVSTTLPYLPEYMCVCTATVSPLGSMHHSALVVT